jgi:hypothetical protein
MRLNEPLQGRHDQLRDCRLGTVPATNFQNQTP